MGIVVNSPSRAKNGNCVTAQLVLSDSPPVLCDVHFEYSNQLQRKVASRDEERQLPIRCRCEPIRLMALRSTPTGALLHQRSLPRRTL